MSAPPAAGETDREPVRDPVALGWRSGASRRYSSIGIGVAQSAASGTLTGTIWIVVIYTARALALIALVACSSVLITPPAKPEPQRDEGVAIETPLAPSFVVKPAHPIAARYNEPYPDALDPQYGPLAAAVHAKRDVRLDFVAGDLASVQTRGGLIDRTLADFFARSYGVVETVQQVGVMHTSSEAELKRVFGDALGFGNVRVGFSELDGALVAVLVYDLRVALDPFPRAIAGSAELRGRLEAGIDRVTVSRSSAGHERVQDEARIDGRGFHAQVECATVGSTWLSLDAGDVNLAQFPVICDGDLVATYAVEPAANVTQGSPEHHVAAVINRERRAAGLQPFELLPVVERSAQALARAKSADTAIAAPPGLAPGTSRWTVFPADSIEAAIGHLLNDPAEIEARATHAMNRIGVGVQPATRGGYWIAIVYAEVPHRVDVAQAERWVAHEIQHRHAQRSEQNVPARDLAKDIANQLSLGRSREEMRTLLKRWSVNDPESRSRFDSSATVNMQIENVTDLDALDLNELVEDRQFSTFGVGVVQNASTGMIWVVVVYNG